MRFRMSTLASASVLATMLALPATGVAGEGMKQVSTAAQHAGYAAGSDNVNGVHTHLHHAVNCLVGPEGEGFDPGEANPCGDMGGAIPNAGSEDMRMKLQEAVNEAMAGIGTQDLAQARKHAKQVQGMLEKASM